MILPLAALAGLMPAGPAAAHGTLPGGSGSQAGVLHRFVATDRLLALPVTGLAPGRAGGWPMGQTGVVATGIAAVLAGPGLGLMRGAVPFPAAKVILLTAMLPGALLLWGRDLRIGVIALPVLLLGWAIGADTDMPADVGATARAGLIVTVGLIVPDMAALWQRPCARQPIIPRIARSWFLAIAVLVLTLRIGTGTGLVAGLP